MSEAMQDTTRWAMIGTGASVTLRLVVLIAWFGLVVGVVWKHRRDAAGIMLVSLGISLVQACVSPLVSPALNFYVSRTGGPEAFVRVNTLVQIVQSVIGLAPQALLMAGIAQLARPRKRDVRDPDVGALGG